MNYINEICVLKSQSAIRWDFLKMRLGRIQSRNSTYRLIQVILYPGSNEPGQMSSKTVTNQVDIFVIQAVQLLLIFITYIFSIILLVRDNSSCINKLMNKKIDHKMNNLFNKSKYVLKV